MNSKIFTLQVPKEYVIDLTPRHYGNRLTPSLSQLKLTLGVEHFTEEGKTKVLCKGNILQTPWENEDERTVASSRKTDFRSTTSLNASPVVLFEQDASLTRKF